MTRLIAISNQKGGSGKTTTAVNLAAALAEQGRRVLVVDLDPQGSASAWLGVEDGEAGLLDVFTQDRKLLDLVRASSAPGVDVVPSSPRLAGIDRALAEEVGPETILRGHLSRLPPRWKYILLDCPPALGILTVNALTSAREVLIAVEAHVMALQGLAKLLQTIEVVRKRLHAKLELAGVLACRVDARTRHGLEVVEDLRRRFADQMYKIEIRENVRLAECPSFRQPITQYDPHSRGAEDYRELAREVIAQERA
jgi:chromosome partitioning protein